MNLGKKSKGTSRKKSSRITSSRISRKKKQDGSSSPPRYSGLRVWAVNHKTFERYLNGLTSAKPFITEARLHFLYHFVRPYQRKAIFARLKDVDPEGLKELRAYRNRLRKAKRDLKDTAIEKVINEMELMVAESDFDRYAVTTVRFIPFEGLKSNIAAMLASGFTREEVCEKLNLGPETVALVTATDVVHMHRKLPEAIVKAADSKVLHDLVEGDVTSETERADRIAGRRRKIQLDAWDKARKQTPSPQEEKDHAKDHEAFFDVGGADEETVGGDVGRQLPSEGVRDGRD